MRSSLGAVFAASDFVIAALTRDPDLLAALVASGDLERTLAPAEFAARAPPPPPPGTGTEAQLQTALRRWRRREFTRIAWRDLAGWADLRRDAHRSDAPSRMRRSPRLWRTPAPP